ncbi:hypothetical protein HME9304_02623 [Flagellimonas maritima]|uniref:Uncharacterized protein n=1 Tax=Flagellimonas maritima TaxID=1383885 RepID=A0A2Z4LUU8_9FLAO|nr:lipocalin-like domain-containing protein [Allomuricauda aurantiaca]AWX45596.1 hypothetical protein HME9304_02623 [Allomuricauda aurantiaca]
MTNSLKIVLALVVILTGCNKRIETSNLLLGSWSIEEIQWISNDTTVQRKPEQKGLLLITPERYSLSWTPIEKHRKPFQSLSNPTDNEVLEGFKTIVFNMGSYNVSNSEFVTKSHLSKVLGFEGGMQYFKFEVTDNKMVLILFDETYPNGEKPDWYGKWETKFSLARL